MTNLQVLKNGDKMRNCIIVCGMHRAGTSLVARLFHEWGVYMGDNLGTPDPANTEGEYENLDFVRLNNVLLQEHGGSWNSPVMCHDSDDRANALIRRYRRKLWGWKDNRTAFTFRAYEEYLQGENILFVICKRRKDAVIGSLFRTHRRQFRKEDRNYKYFSELYDVYYGAINTVSKDYPTLVLHYEDFKARKFFNPLLNHFSEGE